MATIVKEIFERDAKGEPLGSIRPDVLCLSDSRHFVVVELKRPGLRVTRDEVLRFLDYLQRINEEVDRNDTWRGGKVEGVLICDELEGSAEFLIRERGDVSRKTWTQFLDESQRSHRFILERVARRVPPEDPRAKPFLPDESTLLSAGEEVAAELGSQPAPEASPAPEARASAPGWRFILRGMGSVATRRSEA